MKKGLLLLAVVLLLAGCGQTGDTPPTTPSTQAPTIPVIAPTEPPTTAPTEVPTEAPTTVPTQAPTTAPTEPEPVYVYAGAVEDFLQPLEEYSWERQYAPEFVMIHFTSAVVNHRKDPYNMDHIRKIFVDYNISIHYIIQRDGTVRCYVPEDRVAWHAGKGEFAGDSKYTNTMNQYAIGIEVVGIGSQEDMSIYLTAQEYKKLDTSLPGFTQAQYDALKPLVQDICSRYGIPMDRQHVIGHEEYSPHKTDPGQLFDWSKLIPES